MFTFDINAHAQYAYVHVHIYRCKQGWTIHHPLSIFTPVARTQ